MLLAAKAQITPPDLEGPPELREAIDGCHVEVLRLLVQAGADLFHENAAGLRGVEYLFETNNAVLIAAAAKGLRTCPEDLVENIQLSDFVRFLATPDAEEILPRPESHLKGPFNLEGPFEERGFLSHCHCG